MFIVEGRRLPGRLIKQPRRMGPRVRGDDAQWRKSLHLLVGVDTPQALLFDPAVKAVADDAAPAASAFLYLRHHTGLQPRGNRAVWIGAVVERRQFVPGFHGDDRGTAAR